MPRIAPDPDRQQPWLIFDGDCAFCTTCATWIAERLRRTGRPEARLVPWQFTDLEAAGTTEERARHEVLWLDLRDELSGGAAAVAAWLTYAGGPYRILGTMLQLPLIAQLAAAVYRVIAINRHRLPGGSPACALPPPGSAPVSHH